MKFLVALFVVIVAVNALRTHELTEEQRQKFDEHTKFCAEKAGIDFETAKGFGHHVVTDESEANQCYMKCFFEQAGFLNEEGVFQKDVMFTKIGENKSEEKKAKLLARIEKCAVSTGDNVCQSAFKAHNCFWEHKHGHHTPCPVQTEDEDMDAIMTDSV